MVGINHTEGLVTSDNFYIYFAMFLLSTTVVISISIFFHVLIIKTLAKFMNISLNNWDLVFAYAIQMEVGFLLTDYPPFLNTLAAVSVGAALVVYLHSELEDFSLKKYAICAGVVAFISILIDAIITVGQAPL